MGLQQKNAVFLGSSLFTPLVEGQFSRLEGFPNLKNVVQKTMSELLEKFPENEYNILFKMHPAFSLENAINYAKLLTNYKISNPIVLNPKIPMETLIANDYYVFSYPNENNLVKSIFFNGENPKNWTTFFGLQATTTTIHTTRKFYETTFNMTKEEVAAQIPFSNFPIPTYFPVVAKLKEDINNTEPKNYFKENFDRINFIYSYYCPSIFYKNEYLTEYDSILINF